MVGSFGRKKRTAFKEAVRRIFSGAGDGSRTHLLSLGSSRSTDERRPPVT